MWTVEEFKLLKELYPRVRVRDLVGRFPKRTKPTIVAKAMSLNLPSAKLWQPNENKIIRNYFYSVSEEDLIQMLPKRSWLAIMAQGERLGIKRKMIQKALAGDNTMLIWLSKNMLGFSDKYETKDTTPKEAKESPNDQLERIKQMLRDEA